MQAEVKTAVNPDAKEVDGQKKAKPADRRPQPDAIGEDIVSRDRLRALIRERDESANQLAGVAWVPKLLSNKESLKTQHAALSTLVKSEEAKLEGNIQLSKDLNQKAFNFLTESSRQAEQREQFALGVRQVVIYGTVLLTSTIGATVSVPMLVAGAGIATVIGGAGLGAAAGGLVAYVLGRGMSFYDNYFVQKNR